jgi:hypothetical protein
MPSVTSLRIVSATSSSARCSRVGDRRRVVKLLNHVHDLPLAPLLQDRDDQGLVLLGQFGGPGALPGLLDDGALDPEGGTGTGRPVPDLDARDTTQHCAGLSAGHPPDLLDDGERSGGGETPVTDPRHEEHLGLLLGTDTGRAPETRGVPSRVDSSANLGVGELNGDHHARQHDLVVQRQHRQRERFAHQLLLKVESAGLKKEEPPVVP